MEIKRIGSTEGNLVYELFDKYRIFYEQPTNMKLAKQFIDERLTNDESVIFVAIIGNIIPAGFVQLYPKYSSMRATKNWILNDLYVDATYRKQGVGELLIRKAMKFARESGATFVQLETAVGNHTAQKLYEYIGFKKEPPDDEFLLYKINV